MPRRFVLSLLAAALASCASEPQAADDDAVAIYRSLNGRFPTLPKLVLDAFVEMPADPAPVKAAVDAYAPLLDELARATRAPRCSWTYSTPPKLGVDYPLDYIMTAGRLLSVRAQLRLDQGAVGPAVDDLLSLSKFGSDLLQDRMIIGNLLGILNSVFSCDRLRGPIRDGSLAPADLERIERHLRLLVRRYPPFDTVLLNERNAACSLIDEVAETGLSAAVRRISGSTDEEKEQPWMVGRWEEWLRGILNKDRERSRRIIIERWDEQLAKLSAYCKGPLNSRPKTFDRDQIVTKEHTQRMGMHALGLAGEGSLLDAADLLLGLWVPAMAKIPQHFAKGRLWLEITRLGCALELHRLKTGSYPRELRGLGEEPEDPYDGKSLKYRRVVTPDGEGFVLAAAGPLEDSDARMRFLAEECDFDLAKYYATYDDGDTDAITFGVFRHR